MKLMLTFRQPFRNEWPITQKYGEKITSSFHTGIDYGCPLGTPILASAEGIVRFTGMDSKGFGNHVIIEHDPTHSTLYAHLSLISVSIGEKVSQGDEIGLSGSSGNSTGPHLHFEARRIWNDHRSYFDPVQLPLMSVDDSIEEKAADIRLHVPEPGVVRIAAPSGAFAHSRGFGEKRAYPFWTSFGFTGNILEKDGLTFCECTVWIAAHDGETQILKNV